MKLLRWTGSKTKLLSAILENIPEEFIQDENIPFIEPFVGGMSVILGLIEHDIITTNRKIFLYDANNELINFYQVVRDNPEKLIHRLEQYFSKPITKDRYLEFRDDYNKLISSKSKLKIKISALFFLLNITGFNGIYRINKKGEYNVPFGKKSDNSAFKFCKQDDIFKCSKILNTYDITLECKDFRDTLTTLADRCFIYCDPPYYGKYQGYANDYNDDDFFKLINKYRKKHMIMVSNSDTDYVRKKLSKYTIYGIDVTYTIRPHSDGKSKEVLAINY
jgi:DNA adenine methylase